MFPGYLALALESHPPPRLMRKFLLSLGDPQGTHKEEAIPWHNLPVGYLPASIGEYWLEAIEHACHQSTDWHQKMDGKIKYSWQLLIGFHQSVRNGVYFQVNTPYLYP